MSNKLEIESVRDTLGLLKQFRKLVGKVVVPERGEEVFQKHGMSSKDVITHEKIHFLYDMTEETSKNLIRQLCSNSKCEGYFNEETEIYAYLFTLRSKFNLTPIDVINSVDVKKDKKNTVITISLTRGQKKYTIRNTLNTDSSTVKAMECCTGNFGDSLKYLHNTLATIKKRTPQDMT